MRSGWKFPRRPARPSSAAASSGGRVVAVGTTSVRALETAARGGALAPFAGDSRLFIYPGFEFRVVDAMVTNFHLPESSLLMLVVRVRGAARRRSRRIGTPSRERYRFFSYGDAMFVTPQPAARGDARMKFELMTRDGGARRGRITFRRGVDRHAGVHAGRHLRLRESDDARGARRLGRADHSRQHVSFAAAPRHRGDPRARRLACVHALAAADPDRLGRLPSVEPAEPAQDHRDGRRVSLARERRSHPSDAGALDRDAGRARRRHRHGVRRVHGVSGGSRDGARVDAALAALGEAQPRRVRRAEARPG